MTTTPSAHAARGWLVPAAVAGLIVPLGPLIAWRASFDTVHAIIAVVAFAAAVPAALSRPDVFVNAGLLLLASDRFMAHDVGALTLKPGYIAFGYALVGGIAGWIGRPPREVIRMVPRLLLLSIGGLLLLYVLATFSASHRGVSVRYLLVIGGGALTPLVAVLAVVDTGERAARAIAFFVLGQFLVGTYGVYQFAAAYLHLPAPVQATSTLPNATSGVVRVNGISQEAAYHAAYAIAGLPLILSDVINGVRRISSRIPPSAIVAVVLLSLFLTVSRAGYLGLVFVLLGLWYVHRRSDAAGRRRWRKGLVQVGVGLVLAGAIAGAAGILGPVETHLKDFFNPHEATSNSLRVSLYGKVWHAIRDHPVLGVGPDNLGYVLPSYGLGVRPGMEHTVTANDIWLQSAADAGVLTLPFVAALIWVILRLVRTGSTVEAKTLALGAALFLLVSGAFVSFLWDMRVWAVLGLAVATSRAPPSTEVAPSERTLPELGGRTTR